MRIGIDIDGVITNVEEFEVDYGSKYFYEAGKLNTIKAKFDFNKEDFYIDEKSSNAFWSKAIYDYVKIKPRNFASEVIKRLKEEGNTICIITNRCNLSYCAIKPDEMKKIVIKWLDENFIYYDELIFSSGDKVKFIIDNKIDIMIEDSPRNIKAISNLIPVICYSANYNKLCEGNNITRCYSWYDIYNTIREIGSDKNRKAAKYIKYKLG